MGHEASALREHYRVIRDRLNNPPITRFDPEAQYSKAARKLHDPIDRDVTLFEDAERQMHTARQRRIEMNKLRATSAAAKATREEARKRREEMRYGQQGHKDRDGGYARPDAARHDDGKPVPITGSQFTVKGSAEGFRQWLAAHGRYDTSAAKSTGPQDPQAKSPLVNTSSTKYADQPDDTAESDRPIN